MSDETTNNMTTDKPGYKTTEFWLSSLAMLVGVLMTCGVVPGDSQLMKILGTVAMLLSALGYTVARSGVKKAAQVLIIALLPLCILGGCNKGMIKADAVAPLTTDVCDRHDKLVTGQLDPKSLSEADKATYLRSSQLLRKVLLEAQK